MKRITIIAVFEKLLVLLLHLSYISTIKTIYAFQTIQYHKQHRCYAHSLCQYGTKLFESGDNNIQKNEIDDKKYDYLVAIPLEENHDFLLELESVQRGVIYHCPKLADSCIMPVSTRMPLLLISDDNKNDNPMEKFEGIIQDVISKEIYEYSQSQSIKRMESVLEDEGITEEQRKGGLNDEGLQPLMMKFQGLELEDGIIQPNEILYAIGQEDDDDNDSAQQVIRNIINKIRAELKTLGYDTRLPDDQPHIVKDDTNEQVQEDIWRARVPFMRLPANFLSTLENEEDEDEDEEQNTDEDNIFSSNGIKSPEKGYNGISPLFWYKWSNDKFTDTIGIRLRTISIYQRQSSASDIFSTSFLQKYIQESKEKDEPLWTEKMFYIPMLNIPLPIGNALLTQHEAMLSANAMSRLDDVSSKYLDEKQQYDIPQSITGTNNIDKSTAGITATAATTTTSSTQNNSINAQDRKNTTTAPATTKDEIPVIKSLERYREKLRLLEQQNVLSSKTPIINTPMKEYPSMEHFAGIWRLVLSNQNNNAENDNIILRIDGTIAGGPVLSTITTTSNKDTDDDTINTYTQKAASGSKWKFYQAKYIGNNKPSNDDDIISTRVRIQLVIPPHKTHELVLEGEVIKLVMPGKNGNFLQEYGLGDDMQKKENEFYLQAQGEVWMQGVEDGGEKRKMGKFSAVKLATPSKKQLRYSIPPPKR